LHHLTMDMIAIKKYCHWVVEETWVVWLEEPHRFVQLKEPAFFVFEQWASGQDPREIANNCMQRYDLPRKEAVKFTEEILSEIEKLYQEKKVGDKKKVQAGSRKTKTPELKFIEHLCWIGDKSIRFRYGSEEMEEAFRPLFEQFEAPSEPKDLSLKSLKEVGIEISVELYSRKGKWCIGINGEEALAYPQEDWEHFHGAFYTELLNLLHGKKLEEWLGVFHASAVVFQSKRVRDEGTKGGKDRETEGQRDGETGETGETGENRALIFVGESGAGKSTVAAILMANGFRVLTDDFMPVGMRNMVGDEEKIEKNSEHKGGNTPFIYPMPTAISVKKNAIPILAKWYTSMEEELEDAAEEEDYETFLPLTVNTGDLSPIPAKAIFFIKYDPAVDFRLTRESNLEMMNAFLKHSWIANNAAAAEAFLKWYFSLPLYSLVYSDTALLLKGLEEISSGTL